MPVGSEVSAATIGPLVACRILLRCQSGTWRSIWPASWFARQSEQDPYCLKCKSANRISFDFLTLACVEPQLRNLLSVALTEIDRLLLQRCLAEEPGAWRDFVDRFLGLFVHVIQHTAHARSIPITPDDIDELCADVFLALLANNFAVLRQFRAESSLATYLTVVARRVVVREMAKRRMSEALGHVTASPSALEHANVSRSDLQRVENREQVQHMLAGLPEKEAAVLRQYHLEGRSYREISSGLGISENTVGPTLSRAAAKLRERGDLS